MNYLSFNGYNVSTAKIMEYGFFDFNKELLILSTLKNLSACSKVIKRSFNTEQYFWFDQRTFLERPEVSIGIRSLQMITSNLEKLGFIKRFVERSNKGSYSFIKIIDIKFNELIVNVKQERTTTAPDEKQVQEPSEECAKICVPKEEKINNLYFNSYSYNNYKDTKEKDEYTYQDFFNQIDLDQEELSKNLIKQKCLEILRHYVFNKSINNKYYVAGQQVSKLTLIDLLKSLNHENFNQVVEYMKIATIKNSFVAALYTAISKAHSMCLLAYNVVPLKAASKGTNNKFNNFTQRSKTDDEWEFLELSLIASSMAI